MTEASVVSTLNANVPKGPWRVGRHVGRTIYVTHPHGREELIGLMDTPKLAALAVLAVNAYLAEHQDEP